MNQQIDFENADLEEPGLSNSTVRPQPRKPTITSGLDLWVRTLIGACYRLGAGDVVVGLIVALIWTAAHHAPWWVPLVLAAVLVAIQVWSHKNPKSARAPVVLTIWVPAAILLDEVSRTVFHSSLLSDTMIFGSICAVIATTGVGGVEGSVYGALRAAGHSVVGLDRYWGGKNPLIERARARANALAHALAYLGGKNPWIERARAWAAEGRQDSLRHARLPYVDLRGIDLESADLAEATLAGADLRGANLRRVILSEKSNLRGANLEGAILAGLQQVTLDEWSRDGANLSETNLARANLEYADLGCALLHRAYLANANLRSSCLAGATLQNANLDGADLLGVNLSWANLLGASLKGANLRGADLSGAKLSGASLDGATLEGAVYDKWTEWPDDFAPPAGMVKKEKKE